VARGLTDLFEARGATFSPCRTWRYRLYRQWGQPLSPSLIMVMLNPSTADEDINDPTIERCERRARAGGFHSLQVLNLFAYRATDPDAMKAAADPVGPQNDHYITGVLRGLCPGDLVCGGWGIHGDHAGRDREVLAIAERHGVKLHCLGATAGGQPRHPLYVGYDKPFVPWSGSHLPAAA
jgi:hypothetical protein